jgi:hypothetical protein
MWNSHVMGDPHVMDPIGTTAEVHLRPLELLEILEIWQLVKNKTPINLFICETIRQCYLGTIRLLRRSDGLELTPKSISNGLATANRKKERSSRLGISYAITVQSPSRSPASVNLAGRGATPSRFPGCPRPRRRSSRAPSVPAPSAHTSAANAS